MIKVSAALIWQQFDDGNKKFLICRRPKNKARGLLWEFVGGKNEQGETPKQALIRECREELCIDIQPKGIFEHIYHEYPDTSVDLTVFNAEIIGGNITPTEHCEYRWIRPCEIPDFPFCPADREILTKLMKEDHSAYLHIQPETVALGATAITVPKNGFGALPIQRVSDDYACLLLQKAYNAGITFYDTARAYSDSERKIGLALSHVRNKIFIATKTAATNRDDFFKDLETSLENLKTDHIDIYQFHNPEFCPKPGDGSGLYEAMLEARKASKIRYIGITNHRLHVAKEAVESGLYDTLQFPFCYLATEKEHELARLCKEKNIGFIAMKGLSGGLITNARAAYAYIAQFDNILPIWGIQKECELDDFLTFAKEQPTYDGILKETVESDRKELVGSFCRGCGYCMPCPSEIEINNCARMSQLIRRSPSANWLTPQWQEKMSYIENCIGCGKCSSACPYGLDTPALLKRNLEDYKNIVSGKTKI